MKDHSLVEDKILAHIVAGCPHHGSVWALERCKKCAGLLWAQLDALKRVPDVRELDPWAPAEVNARRAA